MGPTNITISKHTEPENDWVEVGEDYEFTCEVEQIKPRAALHWQINNQEIITTGTNIVDNKDTSVRLTSKITSNFTQDNDVSIKCLVTSETNVTEEIESTQWKVDIYCKSGFCNIVPSKLLPLMWTFLEHSIILSLINSS